MKFNKWRCNEINLGYAWSISDEKTGIHIATLHNRVCSKDRLFYAKNIVETHNKLLNLRLVSSKGDCEKIGWASVAHRGKCIITAYTGSPHTSDTTQENRTRILHIMNIFLAQVK